MPLILDNLTLTARMAGHALAYFSRGRWRRATSPWPGKAGQVPADFFGLCVANAPESASDDYVIARLNELGIRHARIDFTYGDRESFTERFLDRLLADRFRVCLHLVQPREEARAMLRMSGAADRWRAFVGDMLNRYGSRVESIEIGATCNRRKWSGYSPAAFFAAWQIAWEEAHGRNLAIAGPNVTDFEPLYNAGWLGELRRAGMLPSVHTDNLFVERATEPEAFDRRIAGRRMAKLLRFNLARKAQLLQDIGAWAGAPTLMCTHVAWSLRRIARFLEDVEEKQADYLARYACIAAASGALTRVYWGPLIGQREGLIDDGTSEYPELPHVTYYEQARGKIENYRLRPAFETFKTVNRLLAGAAFRRRLATGPGLEILEFGLNAECRMQNAEKEERDQRSEVGGQTTDDRRQTTDNGIPQSEILQTPNAACGRTDGKILQSEIRNPQSAILHAVWTTDGNGAGADACYPSELLAQAEIYDRDGQRLERAPRMFSESPLFLVWPESTWSVERRASSGGQANGDRRSEVSVSRQSALAEPESQKSEISQATKEDREPNSSLQPTAYSLQPSCLQGFRFARRTGWDFDVVKPETNEMGLAGVCLAEDSGERVDIRALLALLDEAQMAGAGTDKPTSNIQHPTSNTEGLKSEVRSQRSEVSDRKSAISNQKSKILRKARNTVWSASAPWNAGRTIVIKEFKPRSILRRILDYGKPGKALRSWNGAQELLRRGLATPTPLACLMPGKAAPALGPEAGRLFHVEPTSCRLSSEQDSRYSTGGGSAYGGKTGSTRIEFPIHPDRPSAAMPFSRTATTPNGCSCGSIEPLRIENPMHNDRAASYYICEAFAPAWSARDAFTAFSAGATEFQGIAANNWYEAIAVFLQKLHTRGVYFRDLSAGNLLVRSASVPTALSSVVCRPSSVMPSPPTGALEFSLIDTARARFYPHSLGLRLRLCDLMRICHPLDWPNRRVFLARYLAHNGRRFRWWMQIPFRYYDWKHRVKNALKKIRR
ncbi:MAG: hypothetical protein WC567_08195 [Kiritimatiellia bacterium]